MEALQPRAEGQPATRPPPPDFAKKSFAQMFTKEPQTLTEFPLFVHKGEVAIKLSTAAIEKLSVPFKYALVGKFSHGRPALEEIRKSFSKLDLKAAVEIGLIDYRHVLLRFHLEADFHRVWTRGIWQIGKYPMRVFKWSPSFQTAKETSIVPVWFELPGLPCHLFEKSVLFSIMKAVGVPISVDAATLILARPSVARVNVETDLLRELPSRIWIEHGDKGEGFWQKIVPENLPSYCTSCFRQGHAEGGCSMNEIRVKRNWKTKEAAAPLTLTLLKNNTATADGKSGVPGPDSAGGSGAGQQHEAAEVPTVVVASSMPLLLEHNPGVITAPDPIVTSMPLLLKNIPATDAAILKPVPTFDVAPSMPMLLKNNPGDIAAPDTIVTSMPWLLENNPANMNIDASELDRGEGDSVGSKRDLPEVSGHQKIPMNWKENNPNMAAHSLVLSDPTNENGDKVEKTNGNGDKVEAVRDHADLSGQNIVHTQLEGNASLTTKNSENTTETASKGMLQFDQIGPTPEEIVSKIMANPDVAMAFQNPRVQAAIKVCSQNPLSITKYQNDKEVMDVFNKLSVLFPGVTW